ncbi:DegT/DnrJ/EryC1/StrS family aminotransferase [Streptomyces sp. NPDC060366]|uniref:DegT/DnrJ/EryC1/StrS family aminotransferase n=1 Tax=Streptomyces sp. NPDC060366 TaxID=3347105 RepID=UPI0036497872
MDSKAMPAPASTVPFFTQAESFERLWPRLSAYLDEVCESGTYSNGPKTAELEAALRDYTGARHAIAVGNGTDALVLLLRAAGIGPGDEVIVPAFSFFASASSVALVGAVPVFADVDPLTYNIDPAALEALITPRTKAVMPVHLFCQPADMTAVLAVAERHGLLVLEDSAEGIGMRLNGRHTGLIGAGGVLSFFPTKTLGALGDAGMVLTDDDALAGAVQRLRDHGRPALPPPAAASGGKPAAAPAARAEYARQGELAGTNSKMDELQAAALLTKLTTLDDDIRRRAVLADAYTRRLRGIPGVRGLPAVVERGEPVDPVFYVYLIETDRRDALVSHLAAAGIGTETYYPLPLHLQPCFAHLGHQEGDFPHAEAASHRTVALPLYPELTLAQLGRVCDAVRSFFTGSTS